MNQVAWDEPRADHRTAAQPSGARGTTRPPGARSRAGDHRASGRAAPPGIRVAGPPAADDQRARLVAAPPGIRVADPPAGLQIAIVPAHGGAAATTLAALLRRELRSDPAGNGWHVASAPALPDADPGQIAAAGWLRLPPPEVPVIIAARGNAPGARRAVIAVTVLERRGIWPVAIAVTADGAGPEPRQAAQHLDLLAGRAGPVIRVPFAAALRAGALPDAIKMPGRLRDAIASLLGAAMSEPALTGRPC